MDRIPCLLQRGAERFPAVPAIIAGDRTISYAQLEKTATSLVSRLEAEGLVRGNRLGIISWNRWELPILLFSLFRLGVVACPVSPRFPEAGLAAILGKLDCAAVVDPLNIFPPPDKSGLRHILLDALFHPSTSVTSSGKCLLPLDQEATIVLTSGTTATPKAALHCLGNHYFSALGSNENLPVAPGDRWLLSLPLFHVGGLGILFRVFLAGGTAVIPSPDLSLNKALHRYGITHVSLVSTQLHRLLREGFSPEEAKCLKGVLVGGGPVPPGLITNARETGLPVMITYGLTEMASQVTTTALSDPPARLATAGKKLPYREVAVDRGEIVVRGKTLFKGYVKAEGVVLPMDENGWFKTGDLGNLDQDGYLALLGRKDNMFISGGENIGPEEIEATLCLLPFISRAVVVPVEDAEFGFRPVAFIETEEKLPIDPQAIIAHLETRLPRFKLPVAFHPWPESVRGEALKPNRRVFQEKAGALATD